MRLLFQGREYSWATSLYHFRARSYDPITARWLSKDPIGISGGLNQYVAFGSNPVNKRDPFGLWEWDNDWIELGIGGLLLDEFARLRNGVCKQAGGQQ